MSRAVLTVMFTWAAALAALAGCAPTDVTGCPLEPTEAIGNACVDPGVQCGEFRLCDPCGDTSACELITCSEDGVWERGAIADTCNDGGS